MRPEAIFIIGSGRSGTHLMTECLLKSPHVTDGGLDGAENKEILKSCTISAIMHKPLDEDVMGYYRRKINKSKDKIFVDQCHPNLFNIQQLRDEFSTAMFVMMERDIEPIVSSYLRGIRKFMVWNNWAIKKKIPLPNQFLGIESKDELNLEDHISATKRTMAIKEYMKTAYDQHNDVITKIKFNNLIDNPKDTIKTIGIDFGKMRKLPVMHKNGKDKYKKFLTREKQREIKDEYKSI